MPRNYLIERDAVILRWYGRNPQPTNPRRRRSWKDGPVFPADCLGVPMQVNSPFSPIGHCMVWKYSLNWDGYGTLTIDEKRQLAHRCQATVLKVKMSARRVTGCWRAERARESAA